MKTNIILRLLPKVEINLDWINLKAARRVKSVLLWTFYVLKGLTCGSLIYEVVIGVRILPEDHSAFSIMTLVLYILAAIYFSIFSFDVKCGGEDDSARED